MSPLEMATTEELLDEVSRRHQACAFVGSPLIGGTAKLSRTVYQVHGDSLEILGLVSLLHRVVCDSMLCLVADEVENENDGVGG